MQKEVDGPLDDAQHCMHDNAVREKDSGRTEFNEP